MLDLRKLSEPKRRIATIGAGVLLLAMITWVASQVIAEAPAEDQSALWRRFTVAALLVLPATATLVWRRLSDPNVPDRKVDFRRSFVLFLGAGLLLRRQIGDNEGLMSLLAGGSIGYVAGAVIVYGYDLVTNRLSKGRSWHYPGEPAQAIDQSSKTRSPT